VVDGDVVPQDVAHLVEVEAGAQLAGAEQVSAEAGHAGQALVVERPPDRFQRVVHVPAVADQHLDRRRPLHPLHQPAHEHRDRVPDVGLGGDRAGRRAARGAVVLALDLAHPQPSARGTGPGAFHALALWLRGAFPDLSYEVHHAVGEGDLVTVNSTMQGHQTGPAVFYDEHAQVERAFAATGKPFAITQSHWFRMRDGKVVEHWANRDDLGMGAQLGWFPPSPAHLVRSARLKRRAQRALAG
jgi:predicted ester cyclase